MDAVERFQELTGISDTEAALEILEQFNGNLERAVDFMLNDDDSGAKASPMEESPAPKPPPLSPRNHRKLNFLVNFYLDENRQNSFPIRIDNVRESMTFFQFKKLLLNESRRKLVEAAEKMGIAIDDKTLCAAMRFEGMLNPSGLSDLATLKSMHLPTNNTWTGRFSKYNKRSAKTVSTAEIDASRESGVLNFRVRVPAASSACSSRRTRSSESKSYSLRSICPATTLAGLKRSVSRETGIEAANQVWSFAGSEASSSRIDALVSDLNNSNSSTLDEKMLYSYGLSTSRSYVFEVYDSQAPPASSSHHSSTSNNPRRSNRLKRRVHYDLSPDLDDDDDIEYNGFSDVDDGNDAIVFTNEVKNPHTKPLIPQNLINKPQEAFDNFFHVFIQRYCHEPDSIIPPFLLVPFNEALSQTFNTPRVADRKPLFIYLHHDRSVAVHIFCSQMLCSPALQQFLEANELKIWPWDVTLEDAKNKVLEWMRPRLDSLANEVIRMTIDQYPLLVMLCKLSGSYEVVTIITGQGFCTPSSDTASAWSVLMDFPSNTMDVDAEVNEHFSATDDFPPLDLSANTTGTSTEATVRRGNGSTMSMASSSTRGQLDANLVASELWQKYEIYSERLKPEIAADAQRLAREKMRKEQDRAYEESLEKDRLKMEARQREEAEAARRAAEAAAARAAAEQLAKERQEAAARALRPEPPAGTANIATLRFRLPPSSSADEQPTPPLNVEMRNGLVMRRFMASDTLADVKTFLQALGYFPGDHKLLTTFPRVDILARGADTSTLQELKLVPQETLILERI